MCKKSGKFGKFLAIVGALTIIGGICFLIYKLTKPDYLDEYDDDDYDDEDFDDEDFDFDDEEEVVEEA